MIITPLIVPPSFNVPNVPAQIQTMPLIPDAELKMRLHYTALCYEYTNKTIVKIAADDKSLYNHWFYTNPNSCTRIPGAMAVTQAEYSEGTQDAQDILEKYNPVSNFNHIFNKNNDLLPVPSLINDKLNWSDFPSIESNVAIQPYVW